jgi:phosphatidate phosphatase APP1
VLDGGSNPIAGLPMKATSSGKTDVTAITDANGNYTLADCYPGVTWRVQRGD